jgi:hypothetical protein
MLSACSRCATITPCSAMWTLSRTSSARVWSASTSPSFLSSSFRPSRRPCRIEAVRSRTDFGMEGFLIARTALVQTSMSSLFWVSSSSTINPMNREVTSCISPCFFPPVEREYCPTARQPFLTLGEWSRFCPSGEPLCCVDAHSVLP